MNTLYVIGIDPGVTTGYALWCCTSQQLLTVASGTTYQAERWLLDLAGQYGCAHLHVRYEDATQRTWFGKSGKERYKGAGSVMRDCKRWKELLEAEGIPFTAVPPKMNRTKLAAVLFSRYTGWSERTNEHGRDAAMLIYDLKIKTGPDGQ